MARTALASQVPDADGQAVAYTAANVDGHSIEGGGGTILLVRNGSASSINVTVQTPETRAGLAVAEQVVAVAAGADVAIGRLSPATFDRPTDPDKGKVWVDFSAVATVTVAALKGR